MPFRSLLLVCWTLNHLVLRQQRTPDRIKAYTIKTYSVIVSTTHASLVFDICHGPTVALVALCEPVFRVVTILLWGCP